MPTLDRDGDVLVLDLGDDDNRMSPTWLDAVEGALDEVDAAPAPRALVHDTIVMRSDRGRFCLPEVDIHLPFTAGMNALVTARLTPAVAHEAMTTGRRYGGIEARDAAIVGAAVDDDQVRPVAVGQARALAGKDPATLAAIKQRLYREAVEALGA